MADGPGGEIDSSMLSSVTADNFEENAVTAYNDREKLLRDALQCVQCRQLVDVCVVLQCGHYVCRKCANQIKRSQELSKLQSSMMSPSRDEDGEDGDLSRGKIVCPAHGCGHKTVLSGSLDNYEDVLVSNVAERLRSGIGLSNGSVNCGRCEKRTAQKECKDCGGVAYCERCASLQHSMGALKKHKLTDIGSVSVGAPRAPACPVHPEERLSLFCTRDQTPVCAHCLLLGSHLNHPRKFVGEAFSESLAHMKPKTEKLKRRQSELEQQMGDLQAALTAMHSNSIVIQGDVKAKIAELHTLLNQREAELVLRVQQIEDDKNKILIEQLQGVQDSLVKVQHTTAIADAAMQESDAYAWLKNSPLLEARIDATVSAPMPYGEIPSIDFGCELNVSLEAECLRVMDFQGPTLAGVRCSRPMLAEKRGGVVLSWDPPLVAPPGEDGWREFVLEQRSEDESEYQRVYRGSLPSCELPALQQGYNYYFKVCALGTRCRSEFSEPLEYKTRPTHQARGQASGLLQAQTYGQCAHVTVASEDVTAQRVDTHPMLQHSHTQPQLGQSMVQSPMYLSSSTHALGSPERVPPPIGFSTSKILDFSNTQPGLGYAGGSLSQSQGSVGAGYNQHHISNDQHHISNDRPKSPALEQAKNGPAIMC